MGDQRRPASDTGKTKQPAPQKPADDKNVQVTPKPESSSNYEGAPDREPSGNRPVEIKTETSSSSGE